MCLKSPHLFFSTCGPFSRYFSGSHVCQTCGGSTTWSSTLMIFGSSSIAPYGTAVLTSASVLRFENLRCGRHAEHPAGVAHAPHRDAVCDAVGLLGVPG